MDDTTNKTDNVVRLHGKVRTRRRRDGTIVQVVGRPHDKLTAKQERYAFLVGHEDLNQTAAYRKAYDCSQMTDKSVWDAASKLASHAGVSQRIEYFKARKLERTLHDGPALRRLITDGLLKEAREAERAADRLKAFELLGRLSHVGAWSETMRIETADKPVDELMTELEAKLKALSA